MARSKSWGFPRWGGYGNTETTPQALRMCDHAGCNRPGEHPAPKARNSPDKYWFCQEHAAEYNRSWNYFAGLSYEELRAEAEREARDYGKYASAPVWERTESSSQWTREERRALRNLGLDEDATAEDIKASYRSLAKRFHPDANPGDAAAAAKFQVIHQSYALLRRPEAEKKRGS
jgi:hypothetical protein